MLKNEICQKLDNYDFISFDVFDTLVERCFKVPSDLFAYMEFAEGVPGFAKARMVAETQGLSQSGMGGNKLFEVTLDQIYDAIDPKYKHLKELELDYELKSITATRLGKFIYEHALARDKKIILVSDTYLSADFIVHMLKECGYKGFQNVFVSSSYNKTKRDGNLYACVLQALQTSSSSILHIGDNPHSDVQQADKAGFDSVLFSDSAKNDFSQRAYTLSKNLSEKTRQVEENPKLSILEALSSNCPQDVQGGDFWSQIGYHYAGPMIVGFVQWIHEYAMESQAQHVMFLARDGHLLNQAFSTMFPEFPCSYHYLNRSVIRQLQCDAEQKKTYLKHLENLGVSNTKILMIDVGSVNFTAQNFLSDLGLNVCGGYWIVGANNETLEYKTYFEQSAFINENNDTYRGTGIIEFFMSAPTPPIIGVDCIEGVFQPIYQVDVKQYEKDRIEAIERIEMGVQFFVRAYLDKASRLGPHFEARDVISWINALLDNPSADVRKYFLKIYHASDNDHTVYEKQFSIFQNWHIKRIYKGLKGLVHGKLH